MRLGLIVRAVTRGLGIQTLEIWRHLNPSVTVLIDSLPDRGRWTFHPEWYPGALITEWEGYTAPISVEAEDALLTCDILFSVETPYSTTLFPRAKDRGIATVLYVNPELHREHETDDATAVWVPSTWRLDYLPKAEYVPMPVATDRFQGFIPGDRFLHLGGHKAKADRNGMEIAIRAARLADIDLTITTQDDDIRIQGRNVVFEPTKDNYWEMYEGHGVLVMPRKYGGLCLPVQEALAAGLAVMMTDTSPNSDWPVALVKAQRAQKLRMPGGIINLFEADRMGLAEEMTRMLDLDYRAEWAAKGKEWAEANSWRNLKAEWLARLAELL